MSETTDCRYGNLNPSEIYVCINRSMEQQRKTYENFFSSMEDYFELKCYQTQLNSK